ncbi:hypothetical protein COV15_03250 [Candidatus Woesearchaeota archaeon CG10_big_fil_rev_8_21_14_0_10_34_12]|nr:MAG: hypothetical protein COV15_03250 [Candidatus Woesearchaeota archaeon CG10_big_fil_rev_8_21_14_0_10_34_12]
MMKIMEHLLFDRRERLIEEIIAETKTGRTSAFSAINWMEEAGIVKIRKSGKGRLVRLVLDNHALRFKYYLDSIRLKNLNPLARATAEIFAESTLNEQKIKAIVLFGSILKNEKFNDLDFLILGDSLTNNFLKSLNGAREKIERVFGVIINMHKGEFNLENIFRGICIYRASELKTEDKAKTQYLEFLDWAYRAIKKQDYETAFNNAILNLSYVYSYLNEFIPETKSDALLFFNKKYKIKNINQLKKVGVEIGKEVFK